MSSRIVMTKELRRLTGEALTYKGSRGILAGIIDELVGILATLSGFEISSGTGLTDGETVCEQGLAISPSQAATCAGEFQRTAIFLRGAHSAIRAALEKQRGGYIRVLYAGSGPYAPLAVPLMTMFSPEKVRFTILDLHAESIDSVKSIVSHLGLARSVECYVIADACNHTIPSDSLPDVLLCEAMSTALEREPQVGIMRHLLRQAPEAIMVPESIQIDAFLVDTSTEPDIIIPESMDPFAARQPDRIPLGRVLELNKCTILFWNTIDEDRLPAYSVRLPPTPGAEYRPFLFTTIQAHGGHTLFTHDCNLTGIREVTEIDTEAAGETFQFLYQLGKNPRFIAQRLGDAGPDIPLPALQFNPK